MQICQPAATGRRAVRLAVIDAEQGNLIAMDDAASDGDWDETTQFNLDHRNRQWTRLEVERQATLAA